MRGTLHLLPAADFQLFGAGLIGRNEASYLLGLRQAGLEPDFVERLIEKACGALAAGEPMTRKELAAATGEERLLESWGGLLKPLSYRGLLCCGPMRGSETTFVLAERWLGPRVRPEREEAQREVLRRYLRAFGPAARRDFERWAGAAGAWARPIWEALEPELAEVEVEGRRLHLLKADLPDLEAAGESETVRLLAGFDVFILGHADRTLMWRAEHNPRVSRAAGWISPVVVLGGRVVGVWAHTVKPKQVEVSLELFKPLGAGARKRLKAEVDALEGFFGLPCGIIEP